MVSPTQIIDDGLRPTSLFDTYAALDLIRIMEPETEILMREAALRELVEDEYDSPHGRAWHVSMHASEFPGRPDEACARYLTYRMMNFLAEEPMPPWVTTTGDVGKAGELTLANAWFDGGRMLAIPEDPTKPDVHQLGFVDEARWMTASTDLPVLPFGWRKPYIVEVKCLSGDTVVLTSRGRRRIEHLASLGSAELVNGRGEWQTCPVKSFGKQATFEIKLKRGTEEKVIRATGDHRWFVDQTGPDGKNVVSTEMLTTELSTGHKLTYRAPYSRINKGGGTRPSPFGVARGIVYGDGTIKTSGGGSLVDLFGQKDQELLKFFWGCRVAPLANGGERVTDLPAYFKTDRPDFNQGVSYLYGWLAGYFAADGTVSKNGSCYLDCAEKEPLEYVENLCTYLGIPTRTIYEFETGDRTTPQGDFYPSRQAYRICIQAHGLTEEFFLIDEHRERWLGRGQETPSKRKDRWEVVDVTHGGLEHVYCAIVEGTEQFVLDGFILTGNCKADDVVDEMLTGKMVSKPGEPDKIYRRGPDKKHVTQLGATIGKAHDYDWGSVSVCSECWFILRSDVYERLGLPGGMHPRSDGFHFCPRCKDYNEVVDFELEPPDSGEIYYWSRSWPRKTKSFFQMYDADFMARGLAVVEEAQQHFVADTLPPRPEHFRWALDPCKFCQFKKMCRKDEGIVKPRARKASAPPVTKLSASHQLVQTMGYRPHYDAGKTRAAVFKEWGEKDPNPVDIEQQRLEVVDLWHSDPSPYPEGTELHDALGMTWEQYQFWASGPGQEAMSERRMKT